MKLFGLILISFLCFLLINCGGDKSVDAEQAFLKGDYTTAIEGYLQVHQKDTTNQRVNERLALAYMYRGQELYKKTNNLSSFARNFDQGVKFIPVEPSTEFRRIYSQILFQLGGGYYKARPANAIEKEDFLNKTMTMMHQALDMDSTNVNAQNVLDEIKLNNYQKIVDKAKSIFDRAQKTNDINSYFEAETNIRKAQSMNGTTAEMRRMLSIIHAKTLGVLNYEDGLALAVYKNEFSSGKVILTLAIKSYLSYPVTLSLDNFVLADYRGTMYNVDKEIMARDFNMSGVRQVTLDRQNDYTDGSLVFSIPDSVHLDYVGYRISAGRISKKFFP
jgi:tetratricopeptide (TPR) repeat protein